MARDSEVLGIPGPIVVVGVAAVFLAATAVVCYGELRRGGGEFNERRETDPWTE